MNFSNLERFSIHCIPGSFAWKGRFCVHGYRIWEGSLHVLKGMPPLFCPGQKLEKPKYLRSIFCNFDLQEQDVPSNDQT